MAKRVLIVSYHFYPDSEIGARRVSELARSLCEQGVEVVVLSARSRRYIRSDPALALSLPGLRVISVPVPPKLLPGLLKAVKRLRPGRGRAPAPSAPAPSEAAGGESWRARLRRYYLSLEWLVDDKKAWAALAALRLWGLRGRFDAVISSGPPMTGHIATWLARPALRCPWIMDLRDPWYYEKDWRSEVQSGFSRSVNAALERSCARSADHIVTTTPGLAAILRERYPEQGDSVRVIYNGFGQTLPLGEPPAGALRLLYAGTLYYNRDPFPLLNALAALVRQPGVDRARVSMELVGNCGSWGGIDIARWAREHDLADVIRVKPPVPAGQVPELMKQANVLVNFAQGQPNQIPAKMFDYIASGREMLLITESHSDSAGLALEAGCARVVEPGNEAALQETLRQLYRDYVESPRPPQLDAARQRLFSRDVQNERFVDLLEGDRRPDARGGVAGLSRPAGPAASSTRR